MADILNELEIEFDGFIVYSTDRNPNAIDGKKVILAESILGRSKALVIVAVQSSTVNTVLEYICKIDRENNIKVYDIYR